MTSKNRFYMWVGIFLAAVALLMMTTMRGEAATRSFEILGTRNVIPIDSINLRVVYYGTNTAVIAKRRTSPTTQNYDTLITLPEEDSTYTIYLTLWMTGGDSSLDWVISEKVQPLWQLDDLAGNGLDTMIITVTDSVAVAPIVGAYVQLENSSGTPLGAGTSDATGDVIFGVRSGDSYIVRAFGPATKLYPGTSSFTATAGGVDTINGYTLTVAAATGASNVQVYIDVGTGQIDSTTGLMTIRPRTELTLTLRGNPWAMAGGWFILPRPITKAPDANGRVQFNVPANSKIDLPGSFYELTYKAFDGRSISTGLIRKFWIDTLPDPIRIDSTTQVF